MKFARMNSIKRFLPPILGFFFMFSIVTRVSFSLAGDRIDETVKQAYPGLVTGILQYAQLNSMEKGTVLTARDVSINEAYLKHIVQNAETSLKEQLEKNLLFVLEQEITKTLLLNEALKADARKDVPPDERINLFLRGKAEKVNVSEGELRTFYDQNKDAIGGAPYEQVKDSLRDYLLNEKKQRAIARYIVGMGQEASLKIDAEWLKKQHVLAMDNPVDRARNSGKPTMVEFGATGCRPCDMMQPILTNLRKKYKEDLKVIFVQVREKQILASRYGIRSIPVQAFFDKTGKEVFRHVGFFPQKQVEKIVAQMGVKE